MSISELAPHADSAPPALANPHPHLRALLQAATARGPVRVAVAYPCDASSLGAAVQAQQAGLITPILVGPSSRIQAVAETEGLDLAGIELHDTADEPRAAAAKAAALCGEGKAAVLMKGSLHSDDLLAAAVAREAGLRGSRRASHVFVMDVPGFNRPLLLTDCVVNITPTLAEKRDIAQNAIDLARAIGIPLPHVAILSAVESVNLAMPGTLDAAALCKMAERGQITGGVLDGPLALDNAISAESARNKGIVSAVAGHPDVLLMPSLETGNVAYKLLVYLAGAECAGLVLGMRVPIVLTSRSDSVASRIASCALAVLMCPAATKGCPA